MQLMISDAFLQAERINARVNADVRYGTDMELFRQQDFWEIVTSAGDCDDYAVTKRRHLLDEGVSVSLLRLAVVFTETDEGQRALRRKRTAGQFADWFGGNHAVLVATLPEGDYLLDNRFPRLMELDETGYIIDRIQVAGTRDWVHGKL